MTCGYKRGDLVQFRTHGGRAVVMGHDKNDPLHWLAVKFPYTRHVARVDPRWLRRLRKGDE